MLRSNQLSYTTEQGKIVNHFDGAFALTRKQLGLCLSVFEGRQHTKAALRIG